VSQPNDLATALPPEDVPAPPAQSAPAEATETIPSGAPYRAPAPPEERALVPEPPPFARRSPRPILGPAVSVFAVLLWSFVVFGQFTTSWMSSGPLSERLAVCLVLIVTFASWVAGIRRSRDAMPPRTKVHLAMRAIGIGSLSLLMFVLTVFVATVIGSASSRNHDFFVAFVLVTFSLVAAIAGPPWTSPLPPTRTHRQRFALTALWIAGVVVTLVAGAELAVNG
jgi:hypothetical protein